MLPLTTTTSTIMPAANKTKTSLSPKSTLTSSLATTKLWSLCRQHSPFDTKLTATATTTIISTPSPITKLQKTSITQLQNSNLRHPTKEKNATYKSGHSIKHKRNSITGPAPVPAAASAAAAATVSLAEKSKNEQHFYKLTTLKTNKNYTDNENAKKSKNICGNKKSTICCENAIKRKQSHRCCSLLSPAVPTTSALTSPPNSSYFWTYCLWLCIAISSLAFHVHCLPSPSSSMQQLQKRGK